MPLIFATLSALFFGSCAPVTKYFITGTDPLTLASLFYLGSGLGMLCIILFRPVVRRNRGSLDSSVSFHDIPYLVGMALFGGILAPVTLMYAMKETPAATGSLLLNFEPVATGILAAFLFREAVGKRIWTSMVLVTISCLILSYDPEGIFGFSFHALGVLLACIFWGFDNNISRGVSGKDPFMCIMIKGILAGICTGIIALMMGETIPSISEIPIYLLIGFFTFGGLASVFFLMALRSLGAARTALFLALSPFFGVFFSVLLFHEPFQQTFPIAFCLMSAGVYLLVTEKHSHEHTHQPLVHEHRHSHDDLHHSHKHHSFLPSLLPGEEHSHLHAHEIIIHDHPHKPDLHHQHEH